MLIDGKRMNSCLTLAVQCDGREVTTIEGIGCPGAPRGSTAFIDHDAFQCGYCTPGQIVSAMACIAEGHATEQQVSEWMSGNICRCAAYPQITAAVLDAAARARVEPCTISTTARPIVLDQAFASDGAGTMLIAGGTELLNWFRLGIAAPREVIDIGRLGGLNPIERSVTSSRSERSQR